MKTKRAAASRTRSCNLHDNLNRQTLMEFGMRWLGCSLVALSALLACALSAFALPASTAADRPATVREITIDGPVGPATVHYVDQQLATATANGTGLVLLRIDTPGGLGRAT